MQKTKSQIAIALQQPLHTAVLSGFRMLFGLMILASMIRFGAKGWIDELYVQPTFHFKYFGFDWVKTWGAHTVWLFVLCGCSALFFALGLFYRWSSILLFVSFTYIELLDKTNYLNHYYFVSLVLFLMMFLPAHRNFSLDVLRKPALKLSLVPRWTVLSLQLMLGLVYFYAGLAKLNSDWLLHAMPLKIWLPANNHLPFIGAFLEQEWVAYFFSWFGAAYDLCIPFLLFFKRTRILAYLTVLAFHILTSLLFPIGMFPYVMILATLIFFPSHIWQNVLGAISAKLGWARVAHHKPQMIMVRVQARTLTLFAVFFLIQLLLPWRYLLHKDELFWTEEGYRFSWRVMLMEKMGYAQFIMKDKASNTVKIVDNEKFLTKNQEKMMATQADFMLQYAQMLKKHFQKAGYADPQILAEVHVGLNGRQSQLFVDPTVDLAQQRESFSHKTWILPSNISINGL